MHGDAHAEADRVEGSVEERVRQDAVDLRAERRADLELGGIRRGRAHGQEHLAARNRQRVENAVRVAGSQSQYPTWSWKVSTSPGLTMWVW